MGLKVLSGHFNLSSLGPFPKVTSAPSPLDKGLQKRGRNRHTQAQQLEWVVHI